MKNRIVTAVIIALSPLFSGAQIQPYPQNYFIPPLDTPLIITGSFGEIRDDHFHSGLDLSTGEEEGVPVMAAADGYISRIKISADGYGKALYVTHPNGFVSVYAHLQKFAGPVSEYVRRIQYERQSFEVDLAIKDKNFEVKKRTVIAYSGSSGSAEAPHVHFEIRDEKTEETINPLLFGFPINDHKAPELNYVRIFPQLESGIVNKTDSAESYEIHKDSSGNSLNTLEFPLAFGNIAFGFSAIDSIDGSEARLGIYSAELYVDSILTFSYKYDRISFNETRDVNAHIDYQKKTRDNIIFERCHRLPGDRLKIYSNSMQTGYSYFGEEMAHNILIVVKDFSGNKSQFEFPVITYTTLSEERYLAHADNAVLISNDKGLSIHKSNFDVVIPEGAVYENYYFETLVSKNENYQSDIFLLGDENEALAIPITIGLKPNGVVDDSLKPKLVIVRLQADGTLKAYGGQWKDNFLSTKTNKFGAFTIAVDSIPPTVEKYYVPADMNTMYGGEVRLIIKDELSGIKSFSGRIDDKWHLFEYDKKTDMIIANVDPLSVNLEHTMEITVVDERGNTTVWKSTFYF